MGRTREFVRLRRVVYTIPIVGIEKNRGKRTRNLLFCLVAIAAVAPYAMGVNHPLLHDDKWAVLDNSLVQGPMDLGRIFTSNTWGNRPDYPHMHYRPLSVLTLAATHAMFGNSPAAFRAGNLLLHALCSVLLLALLLRLGLPLFASFVGTTWFAVHPLHSEAVMFAVNREELLSGAFVLGALLVLVGKNAGERGHSPSFPRTAVASILGAAAMLSKESAAMLPFFAVVVLVLNGTDKRRLAPAFLALAVTVAACVGLRYTVLGRVLSHYIPWQDNPLVLTSGLEHVEGALAVLWEAAGLAAAPFRLTVDYGYDVLGIPGPDAWLRAVLGSLVALTAMGVALKSRAGRPALSAAIALAALAWGPISNLVFDNSIILAERNLFVVTAWLSMAIAAFLGSSRPGTTTRTITWIGVTVLCLVLVARTYARTADFESGTRLYASSLVDRPGSTRLHNDLGLELANAHRMEQAEREFRRSLAIDPSNAFAHNNLGILLGATGRPREAAAEFMEALRLAPGLESALNNLCRLMVAIRDERAAEVCRQAAARGVDVQDILDGLEPAATRRQGKNM